MRKEVWFKPVLKNCFKSWNIFLYSYKDRALTSSQHSSYSKTDTGCWKGMIHESLRLKEATRVRPTHGSSSSRNHEEASAVDIFQAPNHILSLTRIEENVYYCTLSHILHRTMLFPKMHQRLPHQNQWLAATPSVVPCPLTTYAGQCRPQWGTIYDPRTVNICDVHTVMPTCPCHETEHEMASNHLDMIQIRRNAESLQIWYLIQRQHCSRMSNLFWRRRNELLQYLSD